MKKTRNKANNRETQRTKTDLQLGQNLHMSEDSLFLIDGDGWDGRSKVDEQEGWAGGGCDGIYP